MKKALLACCLYSAVLVLSSCGSDAANNSASPDSSSATAADNVPQPAKSEPAKPEPAADENITDIKKIAGQSLAQVEEYLGKAENTEKVKGYPCENTDCEKATFKGDKYEIIFKKGKADRITVHGVPDLTSDEEALKQIGLSPAAPSAKNPGTVARWSDVEGIKEISFFTDYILVQVTDAGN
jgi:hypothetical protein